MAAQTVYAPTPPGNGNPFFAGLEELFGSPKAFVQDATPLAGDSGYIPKAAPGGGNAFVAGLESATYTPSAFIQDLPGVDLLPGSGTLTTWLIVGVVGLLAVAYISHKAL